MAFGPLQILAFAFPDTDRFEGRIAEELVKLSDAGTIRIVDVLAVAVAVAVTVRVAGIGAVYCFTGVA